MAKSSKGAMYGTFCYYFGIKSLEYFEELSYDMAMSMIEAARSEQANEGLKLFFYRNRIESVANKKGAPKNAASKEYKKILNELRSD